MAGGVGWRRRSSGWIGLSILLCTACGPPPRPSVSEWRPHWSAARALVPQVQGLEGSEARAACERLLGSLHQVRRELLPAPVAELDRTVEEWVHAAEGLAFECPSAEGNDEAFRSFMHSVELLGAEIDAALAVQTSRQLRMDRTRPASLRREAAPRRPDLVGGADTGVRAHSSTVR